MSRERMARTSLPLQGPPAEEHQHQDDATATTCLCQVDYRVSAM